jgi:hypothetical protein
MSADAAEPATPGADELLQHILSLFQGGYDAIPEYLDRLCDSWGWSREDFICRLNKWQDARLLAWRWCNGEDARQLDLPGDRDDLILVTQAQGRPHDADDILGESDAGKPDAPPDDDSNYKVHKDEPTVDAPPDNNGYTQAPNSEWREAPDEGQHKPIKFRLVGLDDLKSPSTAEYLVKGWFPRKGLVEVWGPPKCGKSFWIFTVMLHVAMGREYRGCRVHQNEIVYLALEGQAGFVNRRDAFYQECLSPGETVPAFKLCGATLDLIKDRQQLIADIRRQSSSPGCIIIDTMNRSLAGSENKDVDMAAYIRAADALQKAFNCLVVIIHHCGIDESRPRGHSSQTGAVDVQISVKKDASGIMTTTVELAKDMAEGATLQSRLKVVDLGLDQDGDPITSCVCVSASGSAGAQLTKRSKLTDNQRRFMDILQIAIIETPADLKGTAVVPPGQQAVTRDMLNRYCVSKGWVAKGETKEEQARARAKISEMLNTLAGKAVIGLSEHYVWKVR